MKALPYKRTRSTLPAKRPRKPPIGERRVLPEIYVRVQGKTLYPRELYAKAHIRVRRGCYRFLVWRDGNKIREFYLGRLAKVSPTPGPGPGRQVRGAGEASSSCSRRVRK